MARHLIGLLSFGLWRQVGNASIWCSTVCRLHLLCSTPCHLLDHLGSMSTPRSKYLHLGSQLNLQWIPTEAMSNRTISVPTIPCWIVVIYIILPPHWPHTLLPFADGTRHARS
jgi:hypothetical protein